MSYTHLKGKVAFITGASKGIGACTAKLLAKQGIKIACIARSKELLEKTCEDIRTQGGTALAIPIDLYSEPDIIKAINITKQKLGNIDILINNAGMLNLSDIVDTSTEIYEKVMDLNVKAIFITCREILPDMIKSKSGTIINIGSLAGRRGYPSQSIYCASKHAVAGFTKALALETKNHNIRVHLLCPGGVLTDMTLDLRKSRGEEIKEDNPEWMTAEEIVEGVLYLLSQKGAAITDELVLRRYSSEPWR